MARRPYGFGTHTRGPVLAGSRRRASLGATDELATLLEGRRRTVLNCFFTGQDIVVPDALVETDIGVNGGESVTLPANTNGGVFASLGSHGSFTTAGANNLGAQWVSGTSGQGFGAVSVATTAASFANPVTAVFGSELAVAAAQVANGNFAVGMLPTATAVLDINGAIVAAVGGLYFHFVGGSTTHSIVWGSAAGNQSSTFTFTLPSDNSSMRVGIRLVLKGLAIGTPPVVAPGSYAEFWLNGKRVGVLTPAAGTTWSHAVGPGIAGVRLTAAYIVRVAYWGMSFEQRGSPIESAAPGGE